MAVPPQRDPIEQIIKENNPAEASQGEVITRKRGFLGLSKLNILLRRPLEPVAIPFPTSGMILAAQRIRLQGVINSYDTDNVQALVGKRFPSSGQPAGMNALCAFIITRVQKHGSGNVPLPLIADKVEMEICMEWGLLCNITLLIDQPDTIHSRVTVPCKVRGWPHEINITHEISLKQVDPIRAASVGRLNDEKLREWSKTRLSSITQEKFAELTMDQVVRHFGRRRKGGQETELELEIKAPISQQAQVSLGYKVEIYTASPELGLGEISEGFDVEVEGSYRTKDFAHGKPFQLITSFKVTLNNLMTVLERKWLDPANPGQDPVGYARKDLAEPVRRAVQKALNQVSTYTFLTQLDGISDLVSVQDMVRNEVEKALTTFDASVQDFVVLRPMQDELTTFVAEITRECHGTVEFFYKPETRDEIRFKAAYHVGVNASEATYQNFFQVSFLQIGNVAKLKARIEEELKSCAHQFLQQGNMLSQDAMLILMAAPSANLKSGIFDEAGRGIESMLGLELRMGPLERTLPHRVLEDEKLKRALEGKKRELHMQIMNEQSKAMEGISSTELALERLRDVDNVIGSTGSGGTTELDFSKMTSLPTYLLGQVGGTKKPMEKAANAAQNLDEVIDATIAGTDKDTQY
jgi:hypothetical protein